MTSRAKNDQRVTQKANQIRLSEVHRKTTGVELVSNSIVGRNLGVFAVLSSATQCHCRKGEYGR